jgi:DNA polymerase elongation subunit (family B)
VSDKKLPIYTLDIETDPFVSGRKPKPFCIGLFDGQVFTSFWGNKCIEQMRDYIQTLPKGVIYLHNGGRFDIFYLMEWVIGNPMKIINGRIVKSEMHGVRHQLRDSYAIMPFALGSFGGKDGKLDIDYKLMEAGIREDYKDEILVYLKRDVTLLWRLCVEFVDMFGMKLTIGGTAMGELRKVHNFERLTLDEDKPLRERYFYGGRVECFESGVIEGSFKVYDVNSMYPHAMSSKLHPVGKPIYDGSKITKDTCFVTASGWNYGAFPSREKMGLTFKGEYGTYHVTRHEWNMAEHLGLFDCERVISTINFDAQICFDEFVDKFYSLRMDAQAQGDEIKKLFYKLILNSSYGKFAQSSENYCESRITEATEDLTSAGWECVNIADIERDPRKCWLVWERPSLDETMYNVATGSSITGAARAMLMEAIHTAKRPIYCDTDSLICEELGMGGISKALGEWKLEAECDKVAIAGKKLYALFNGGDLVKQANKGVNITAAEILRVCEGETIKCIRDAPSFKLDGSHVFIDREVRMTV